MRMSQLVGMRHKETPAEASLISHIFLLRGAYARQVANGIYSLLPTGLRVAHKIQNIIREEMNGIGGQEVEMPLIQPRELWDESGRYYSVGSELLRFTDRTHHEMVLAMTHEEGVVHLCRHEVSGYHQLPFMVYQIQTKFRDEPRSRGGLIRVREFTMKDAYSFHTTHEDLEAYYWECHRAYHRIFDRVGIPEVVSVESDSGMMGGRIAHEFMLLTDAGEDTIVTSDDNTYLANQEVALGDIQGYPDHLKPLEKVLTPGLKSIEEVATFLNVPQYRTAKCVFYEYAAPNAEFSPQGVPNKTNLAMAVIRGDREVNESKLSKILLAAPFPASEAKILESGAVAGFASPIGIDPKHCKIVIDHTIKTSNNLVTGANELDYHYLNFNLERDLPSIETVDIVKVADGDKSPVSSGKIVLCRGIEVGNIFQLGTKYTEAMKMSYLGPDGRPHTPIMGCYGIGIGRLLCSVMEVRHDQFGPKWPISIAPWQVHLNALKMTAPGIREAAENLYQTLKSQDIEVLYDDRDAQVGVQFAEADLLGIPFRLIIGERNLKQGLVEWKRRDTGESGTVSINDVISQVKTWIQKELGSLNAVADQRELRTS